MNALVPAGTLIGSILLAAGGGPLAGAALLGVLCSAWFLWSQRDAMAAASRETFKPGDPASIGVLAIGTMVLGVTAASVIAHACALFLAAQLVRTERQRRPNPHGANPAFPWFFHG